jgi:hypothetical protein
VRETSPGPGSEEGQYLCVKAHMSSYELEVSHKDTDLLKFLEQPRFEPMTTSPQTGRSSYRPGWVALADMDRLPELQVPRVVKE